MVQIAGPNGCGKTTFYRRFLQPVIASSGKELAYINADDIALEMRSGDTTPAGLDPALAEQARNEADFRRNQLLAEGFKQSAIFETVFSDPKGIRLDYLKRAKAAGYKVVQIFIAVTDVQLSAKRVQQRVAEGGHDVPFEKQLQRFERSLANGRSALNVADLSLFLDNSETYEGRACSHDPVAVFLGSEPLVIESSPPHWFKAIHS